MDRRRFEGAVAAAAGMVNAAPAVAQEGGKPVPESPTFLSGNHRRRFQ